MFDNYTGLVSAVSLVAKKPRLMDQIDTYIGLAEADMNRELRHPEMESPLTLVTVTDGAVDLPADFLELRDLRVSLPQGEASLELSTPERLNLDTVLESTSPPVWYTLESGQYRLYPQGDSPEVYMLYYKRIPALSSTSNTNWVIVNYPKLYYYGCLLYLNESAQAYDQEERYAAKFASEVQRVRLMGQRKRQGGQHMRMRAV